MALKKLKKLKLQERPLQQLQDNVDIALNQVVNRELLDGQILQNISLSASGVNEIEHKLGRELLGWMVVRSRAQSTVWDNQDDNVRQSATLLLNASADVVVDLWVF